jgi:hypothetical protein
MNTYVCVLRMALVRLALLGTITGATDVVAQTVTSEETVHSVRRMLQRLPYAARAHARVPPHA